mmetsp:Transcript_330/g.704  ORF Transcript_330/g.704 Transcript_330/m.704 type:complete len:130 (-) Transcript_330:413-802(-)
MGSIIGTGTIICGTSSACIVGVMMVGVHVESISVFISANPTAAAVVVASVSAVDVVAPTAPGPSPGATDVALVGSSETEEEVEDIAEERDKVCLGSDPAASSSGDGGSLADGIVKMSLTPRSNQETTPG